MTLRHLQFIIESLDKGLLLSDFGLQFFDFLIKLQLIESSLPNLISCGLAVILGSSHSLLEGSFVFP